MAGNRKALLIGVGYFQDRAIVSLPVVARDLAAMYDVLCQSDYEVTVHADETTLGDLCLGLGLEITEGDPAFVADAGANAISKAIEEACQQASPDDTLILYLSGHGGQLEGEDVYFSREAIVEATSPSLFERTVVPLRIIADQVANSRAGATIVLIDACRNRLLRVSSIKSVVSEGWSAGETIPRQAVEWAFVFGCERGEVCRFSDHKDSPSYFTEALVQALDPSNGATRLEEVIEEARVHLKGTIRREGGRRQTITVRPIPGLEPLAILDHVICDGPEPDTWTPVALASPLWALARPHRSIEGFRDAIKRVGKICWGWHLKAVAADPDDPWRDPESVVRSLKRLSELVDLAKGIRLDAAEVAGLIVAPLVREGILAAGLVRLDDDKKNAAAGMVPSPLDEAHTRYHRIAAQADRLRDRDQDSDRDAVLAWLDHQAIAEAASLGHASASGGAIHPDLRAALELPPETPSLVRDALTAERMIRLAFAGSSALESKVLISGDDGTFPLREALLGDLLLLAAAKAIDPRALPVVVVEHVGLTAGSLDPAQIIPFARRATWNENVLTVKCDHPALHLALEEQVEQAEETRARIAHGSLAGLKGPSYSADVAVARGVNNVPAYTTPLLRFQLDHNEVRELLMGETLYGDPNLAIRELYQNALDACRYRRARTEYRSRKSGDRDLSYTGKISFIQGVDDRGRPYIECRDNGIGMGIEELTGCFAKAGRRFAQMPEAIRERAEWERQEPPIRVHPNSRFGVGVFSYFMLADEIQFWTRRLNPDCTPGKCLHVTVPGSGSLFRIRGADDLPQGGTRIRLYLNKTEHAWKPISCLEFLREILWVAEFETDVSADGMKQVWPVDRLMGLYEEPEDAPQIDSPDPSIDAWWVAGTAAILSDGIAVATYDPFRGERQKFPLGPSVVNLRGDRRPRLTVDRKSIIALDLGAIHSVLRAGAPALDDWRGLSSGWLDRLLEADVAVADRIVTHLMEQHRSVEVWLGQGHVATIDLAETGYARGDGVILGWWAGGSADLDKDDRPLTPLRMALFKRAIMAVRDHAATSVANLLKQADRQIGPEADGAIHPDCPAIGPIDALLIGAFSRPKWTSVASTVWAATTFEESIEQIASRVMRLESFQDRMPGFDRNSVASLRDRPGDIEIRPDDLLILSVDLDGIAPFLDAASPGHLVRAAVETGRSASEVAGRLRELGVRVEAEPEAGLAVGRDDLIILSRNLDGGPPFIAAASTDHVLRATYEMGRPPAEIAARLGRFGVPVPEIPDDLTLDRDDFRVLSLLVDGRWPYISGRVRPGHLAFASFTLKQPIAWVYEKLRRLQPLGVEVPDVEAGALGAMRFQAERDHLVMLSRDWEDTRRGSRRSSRLMFGEWLGGWRWRRRRSGRFWGGMPRWG